MQSERKRQLQGHGTLADRRQKTARDTETKSRGKAHQQDARNSLTRRNTPVSTRQATRSKTSLGKRVEYSSVRLLQPQAHDLSRQHDHDADTSYRPLVVGGESQCRSIWVRARVHSAMQAAASCSTPAAVGVLPPHICGLTASCRACLGIKFLNERSAVAHCHVVM